MGTIIHGTMRPQDLIPAFIDALREHAPDAYVEMMSRPFPLVPAYVWDEGDESDWWMSEEASWVLMDLFDALDTHAPEGHYFGAHPGDGSDYGFWELDD